jgi:hypothetical protein
MGRPKRPPTDFTGQVHLAVGSKVVPIEPERSVLARTIELMQRYGGVYVMRNTVGAIRKGQRFISYGLGKGSSDVVAIVAPYGRWLCVEAKRGKGGRYEDGQEEWLAKVRLYGAVSGTVRKPEDVIPLIEEARRPFKGAWS